MNIIKARVLTLLAAKRGEFFLESNRDHFTLLLCIYAASAISILAVDPPQAHYEHRFTRNQGSLAVSAAPFLTNGISDLVPESWVVEAVKQKAGEMWTEFSIGAPIPCSDPQGQLIFYHVPVAVGTNHFPDILTPPPAEEISSNDLHSTELWGATDYWTFDVSARRSYYPIPHYGGGLPPFLVTYYKALELAAQRLNDSHVQLTHYYATGLSDEYYDFSTASGSHALINSRNLQCQILESKISPIAAPSVATTNAAALSDTVKRESLKQDYERQAGEAWDKISKNIQKDN